MRVPYSAVEKALGVKPPPAACRHENIFDIKFQQRPVSGASPGRSGDPNQMQCRCGRSQEVLDRAWQRLGGIAT